MMNGELSSFSPTAAEESSAHVSHGTGSATAAVHNISMATASELPEEPEAGIANTTDSGAATPTHSRVIPSTPVAAAMSAQDKNQAAPAADKVSLSEGHREPAAVLSDTEAEAGRGEDESLDETEGADDDDREDAAVIGGVAAARYAAPSASTKGKILRSLPVFSVLLLMTCLLCIYVVLHLLPLLELQQGDLLNPNGFTRGVVETVVFLLLLLLQLICFFLSVFTSPGDVTAFTQEDERRLLLQRTTEVKRSGERRECKWCLAWKPDRTHHCRVCRSCILKMDHHCPWIANCVGWGNHKFFFLFIFYSCILSVFIAITMFEAVKSTLDKPFVPFEQLFLLLFGETLDVFLAVVVTGFLLFHLHLILRGLTTIEFCEKRFGWHTAARTAHSTESIWDRGCWINWNEAFGYNPLLWFLPIDNRPGNGVTFISNEFFQHRLFHHSSAIVAEKKQGE